MEGGIAFNNDGGSVAKKEVKLYTPGELITNDAAFMRGHGTFQRSKSGIYAAVAGRLDRIAKLISVKSPRFRYTGDVGDVVLGRIIEVGSKRWKVDCNSKQEGVLLLASITLPGAVQRRRSHEDELQMRLFFSEGDMLVAEVQTLYQDGAIGLHTRSTRYGKLGLGELVRVQPSLIRRSRSHFLSITPAVEVILGMNGLVWVGLTKKEEDNSSSNADDVDRAEEEVSLEVRKTIVMIRNSIILLDRNFIAIDEESIKAMATSTYHHQQ